MSDMLFEVAGQFVSGSAEVAVMMISNHPFDDDGDAASSVLVSIFLPFLFVFAVGGLLA